MLERRRDESNITIPDRTENSVHTNDLWWTAMKWSPLWGKFSKFYQMLVIIGAYRQRNIFVHRQRIRDAINTAQKWTFFIKDFFSKCDQIRGKLRIGHIHWRNLYWKSSFFVQWNTIDPVSRAPRRSICIMHWVYNAPAPNSLW